MFNKNCYLFPQAAPNCNSLSHHPSTSVAGITGDEILFHHHDDSLSGHYFAAAAAASAPVVEAAAFFNQDVGGLNGDPSAIISSCPRAAAKKDRHSKIYTAQGPRDRRVRLSIGVARRFFDLQEILGFDKPSKTLDWLLTKSKTAIKDLVQTKENASKSFSSSPSECDVDSGADAFENGTDSKRKSVMMNADGKQYCKEAAKDSSNPDLAKESRVKARARARKRTREKMCIKKLSETRDVNNGYEALNPSIPIHYMNNQLDQFCKISGSSCSNISPYTAYETADEDGGLIQESLVIKTKVKHPSSLLGFQQNLFISSSNYAVPTPYDPTDNWDISAIFASQSNIYSILDQHKFINNSTSNN